ncbi:hypothetical protein Ddye_032594 [Dipteronia dyeriana]|uniref:Uncharacterized protein n=1 Tax=Dipteronia dyeriana TaxID=168575 RepID=A0AAD9TD76_9ROSI|nr:hypothetical protein Ddye_032594 [Dipteronia dyeriana]
MKLRDKSDYDDIKNLATCLKGKLENLYPLSEDCYIYRVPLLLHNSKGGFNPPQTIAIRPRTMVRKS